MSNLQKDMLIAGIDAGGTKSILCARSLAGLEDVYLRGPAANAQRDGVDHAAGVIVDLVAQACAQRPRSSLGAVFAGVAGAGRADIRRSLLARLHAELASHSNCRVEVAHDGIIALEGALRGHSGLLLLAGTGSAVFARTKQGQAIRVGGWGAVIGDEGGGYAMGRSGLAAVTCAMDGGPATVLTDMLASEFKLSSRQAILKRLYEQNLPLQQLAPLVIQAAEQDDPLAARIVESQAKALARQASWLIADYPEIAPKYSIYGGLSHSPLYVRIVRRHMTAVWPEASWLQSAQSALEGAVRLALTTLSDEGAG